MSTTEYDRLMRETSVTSSRFRTENYQEGYSTPQFNSGRGVPSLAVHDVTRTRSLGLWNRYGPDVAVKSLGSLYAVFLEERGEHLISRHLDCQRWCHWRFNRRANQILHKRRFGMYRMDDGSLEVI